MSLTGTLNGEGQLVFDGSRLSIEGFLRISNGLPVGMTLGCRGSYVWNAILEGIGGLPTSSARSPNSVDFHGEIVTDSKMLFVCGDRLVYALNARTGGIVSLGTLVFVYKESLDYFECIRMPNQRRITFVSTRHYAMFSYEGHLIKQQEFAGLVFSTRTTGDGAVLIRYRLPNGQLGIGEMQLDGGE